MIRFHYVFVFLLIVGLLALAGCSENLAGDAFFRNLFLVKESAGEQLRTTQGSIASSSQGLIRDGCYDTDGGDAVYEAGSIYFDYGPQKEQRPLATDKCLGTYNLREYYCDNSSPEGYSTYMTGCPQGCENNACVEEPEPDVVCSETDGGLDYYEYGELMILIDGVLTVLEEDSCLDATVVEEFYCSSGSVNAYENQTYSCEHGCEGGECAPATKLLINTTGNTSGGGNSTKTYVNTTGNTTGNYTCQLNLVGEYTSADMRKGASLWGGDGYLYYATQGSNSSNGGLMVFSFQNGSFTLLDQYTDFFIGNDVWVDKNGYIYYATSRNISPMNNLIVFSFNGSDLTYQTMHSTSYAKGSVFGNNEEVYFTANLRTKAFELYSSGEELIFTGEVDSWGYNSSIWADNIHIYTANNHMNYANDMIQFLVSNHNRQYSQPHTTGPLWGDEEHVYATKPWPFFPGNQLVAYTREALYTTMGYGGLTEYAITDIWGDGDFIFVANSHLGLDVVKIQDDYPHDFELFASAPQESYAVWGDGTFIYSGGANALRAYELVCN